ncbi:MAG: hypothetical protein AB1735_04105 [Pseudomonadota bacterium]
MELPLADIAAVLGCSKAVASRLRAGKYELERPSSELIERHQALLALVQRTAQAQRLQSLGALCFDCPRDDCAGCRVAELG